eukprot:COSAG02_NODE_24359_length_690_cov_1.620981_1_plen_80_part_10
MESYHSQLSAASKKPAAASSSRAKGLTGHVAVSSSSKQQLQRGVEVAVHQRQRLLHPQLRAAQPHGRQRRRRVGYPHARR